LPGRLRFSFIAINLFLFSSLLTPDWRYISWPKRTYAHTLDGRIFAIQR
jgi:hypothetical protein